MPPKSSLEYSAEQVDTLLVKFENAAAKQTAEKEKVPPSQVRLPASERDLLKQAEASRDLMMGAVKGDKPLLAEVFGGNCERFWRYRNAMNSVTLSDMHASDQRWGHLKEAIDMIEEVLKSLGKFKPWQIGQQAPEYVTYTGCAGRYNPGGRVQMFAECNALDVTYSLKGGNLPEGIFFNPSNGEIIGMLPSGLEFEGSFTITATNDKGSAVSEIVLSVKYPKPEAIEYDAKAELFTGDAIAWDPKITGGMPSQWSVVPTFPNGLAIDPKSGKIMGAPMLTASSQDYIVTGTNGGGSASVTISLGVKMKPPTSLEYRDAQLQYPFGSVLQLFPTVKPEAAAATGAGGRWAKIRQAQRDMKGSKGSSSVVPDGPQLHGTGLTYTVQPALPTGLALNAQTGVLSGKPEAPSPATVYKVTAKNASGETSVDLPLEIKLSPPSSLSFPEAADLYFTSEPMSVSPTVQGLIEEWSVEPALPPGMSLDPRMGSVEGTPTEVVPKGSWTVTARNAEGESSTTLSFAVQRPAPSKLVYPNILPEYALNRALTLYPSVAGAVDAFTVSPELPTGLQLDSKTGVVTGSPTAISDEGTYVVTAKNETGGVTAELVFSVKLMPPDMLTYPSECNYFLVGEEVKMEPYLSGAATTWIVEPPLPEGLVLDGKSGVIEGTPSAVASQTPYSVTASNEAGGTSATITFAVNAPPPRGLSYPFAQDEYVVGADMLLEPDLKSGMCSSFAIEPVLPAGLRLDEQTGAISGSPTDEADEKTYKITGKNSSGSTEAELTFLISEAPEEMIGDQAFAAQLDAVTDVTELPPEPVKSVKLNDWMVWMVHRAWLNDPTLTDFSFNCMKMPLPYLEPRVAPKLMKAMEKNTHIVSLNLADAHLQKPQGPELAEALKLNTTLQFLNIETNHLDSECIKQCALALAENSDSGLEQWRFSNQKSIGQFFGRPVEEALETLMRKNMTILKLGFTCHDAHWRNEIDKCLLRNGDFSRRKRRGSISEEAEDIAAEKRTLAGILISVPPQGKAAWEVFANDCEKMTLVRGAMASTKTLPTNTQLQAHAKSAGTPLKFAEVAPIAKSFRAKLLNAVVNTQITLTDAYGAKSEGMLRAWTEKNESWHLDVFPAPNQRFDFESPKQPKIEISDEFAEWLKPQE